jgi:hypothetical protein
MSSPSCGSGLADCSATSLGDTTVRDPPSALPRRGAPGPVRPVARGAGRPEAGARAGTPALWLQVRLYSLTRLL